MKRFRKWFCTLISAVMLLCCAACDLPETPRESAKSPKTPAETTVSITQTVEQTTTTAVDDSTRDLEARIEFPRPTGDTTISVGSKGDDVRWVQAALNKVLKAGIDVDGDFGNTTKKYVKDFQELAGLNPDGNVGPNTIEKLVAVASGNEYLAIITTEITKKTKTTTTTSRTTKKTASTTRTTTKTTKTTTVATTRRTTTQTTAKKKTTGYYILNTKTKKIHIDGCRDISAMKAENKKSYSGSYQDLTAQGYTPCGHCHPNKYAD